MVQKPVSRRKFLSLASSLGVASALQALPFQAAFAAGAADVTALPMGCAYSQSTEEYIRDLGLVVSLDQVGQGEFASFCFYATNNAPTELEVRELYVTVDGGEPWGWLPTTWPAGSSLRLHVYFENMQRCLVQGSHVANLYLNGQLICSADFTVVSAMDWESVFPLPAQAEVEAANRAADSRSPYVFGQYDLGDGGSFATFSVDFKADLAPRGTYCCLFQWAVDLAEFQRLHPDARTDFQVGGYGGLQHLSNGNWASILSFWDVYYTDETGAPRTLRAELLYPEPDGNGSFGGEGEGAHRIVEYPWKEGSWYRMVFNCTTSQRGTTVVEQTVCDLQTGTWTLLCRYDTCMPGAFFKAPGFFFLEDYDKATCGEVRTMEVANAFVKLAQTGEVVQISQAYMGPNGGRPAYGGSYAFGAQDSRFWAITSGAGGDWFESGQGQQGGWHQLSAL